MQINCSGVLSPPAELAYLGRPSLREAAFVIPDPDTVRYPQRDFFIDKLLVRIHLINEMTLVDRPCAMAV